MICLENGDPDTVLRNHKCRYEADLTGADNDYIGVGCLGHFERQRIVVKVGIRCKLWGMSLT